MYATPGEFYPFFWTKKNLRRGKDSENKTHRFNFFLAVVLIRYKHYF